MAYASHEIRRLEAEYPPLDPALSSTSALRNPASPRHHTPHVDIYAARIPTRALAEIPDSNAWARFFLNAPAFKLYGAAPALDRRLLPGDTAGGGSLTVTRADPLLAEWTFPPGAVGFVRAAAVRARYPWRFMSGGRHEWTVVGPGRDEHGEMAVEVRFASAHDYEVVPEEGARQKTVPEWTARLHRAYARWLLDERVRALKRDGETGRLNDV
jgi:hypothetical protein